MELVVVRHARAAFRSDQRQHPRKSQMIRDKRVVMAGSGHKTEVMLDHYAEHLENEAALEKLLNAQEALFLPVIKDAENNTPSVLKAASNF